MKEWVPSLPSNVNDLPSETIESPWSVNRNIVLLQKTNEMIEKHIKDN